MGYVEYVVRMKHDRWKPTVPMHNVSIEYNIVTHRLISGRYKQFALYKIITFIETLRLFIRKEIHWLLLFTSVALIYHGICI